MLDQVLEEQKKSHNIWSTNKFHKLLVKVTAIELDLGVVMGPPLRRLDMTVASQVYLPASEKVREVIERVFIVLPDIITPSLNHW